MKKLTLTLILLLCVLNVFADFASDFKAINESLINANKLIRITNTVTSNGNKETVTYQIALKSIRDYYLKTSDTEVIVKNGIKVSVNHDLKVVMVDSQFIGMDEIIPTALLDSMKKMYKSVEHKIVDGDHERYTLIPKFGRSKSIVIDFSRSTFLIKNIKISMTDPGSGTNYIIENAYSYSALSASDLKTQSDYVIFDKNSSKIRCNPKFNSYQLINNLPL